MPKNENKKFFFHLHDFQKEADDEKEKRRNKNPPPPSFSLEDMEGARKAAFEDGRQKGLQMASDSIEQQTELLVQSVIQNIRTIETAEDQRHADYIDHSVAMSYKALQVLLPAILDAEKQTLIQNTLHDFFANHSPKTSLTLHVHDTMVAPMTKYAAMLSPSMKIEGDSAMQPTQARIEWVNGAFEFTPDRLVEQILQTIHVQVKEIDQPPLDDSEKNPHNDDTQTEHASHQDEQDSKS